MNEQQDRAAWEELEDFESRLRELSPWTPPVVFLRPETEHGEPEPKRRKTTAWPSLGLGLVIGLLLGCILGTALVPRPEAGTVEIVRDTASVSSRDDPVMERQSGFSYRDRAPDILTLELDRLIGRYDERARLFARHSGAPTAAVSTVRHDSAWSRDDDNSLYRLRESMDVLTR